MKKIIVLFFLAVTMVLSIMQKSFGQLCPTADFTHTSGVCNGGTLDIAPAATCAGFTGVLNTGTYIDWYIYDNGITNDAGTYSYTVAPIDEYPLDPANLTNVNFDLLCDPLSVASTSYYPNETCGIITVTLFGFIYDYDKDDDADLIAEYKPECPVIRFDFSIYPAPFTAVATDGACDLGAMVEFQSADGTVCACNFGPAPVLPYCTLAAGDVVNSAPLNYSFLVADYAALLGVSATDIAACAYTDITGTALADCPSCICPPPSCIQRCIGEDIPVSSVATTPNPALTTLFVLTDDAGVILQTSTGADFSAATLIEGDTHYIYAINYDGMAAIPAVGGTIAAIRTSADCIDVSEPCRIIMICCAGAGAFPATDIENINFPHGH